MVFTLPLIVTWYCHILVWSDTVPTVQLCRFRPDHVELATAVCLQYMSDCWQLHYLSEHIGNIHSAFRMVYRRRAWIHIAVIRQKQLRRSRGKLFTLFIQWQCPCHAGWRCSMLSFRLFQIGATNSAVIFSANCLIHLIAFIICCHPHCDTEITSRLRKATTYFKHRNRTNCYKSFIYHAFIKYQ